MTTSRIPLLPEALTEPAELVAAVRARRGGTLLPLDRLLLYSPNFTQGWNALLKEVRGNFSVEPLLRELAILTVAIINDATPEIVSHTRLFLEAGGTTAQVDALKGDIGAVRGTALFDARAAAVLDLAVEMTRDVAVSDTTFRTAHEVMGSDQTMIELIGTIATYNMVARFLVALDVRP